MRISKQKIKELIRESLITESLDSFLYAVLDQELPAGSPAEAYLKAALKDKKRAYQIAPYLKQYAKEDLLTALSSEMEKNPSLY